MKIPPLKSTEIKCKGGSVCVFVCVCVCVCVCVLGTQSGKLEKPNWMLGMENEKQSVLKELGQFVALQKEMI